MTSISEKVIVRGRVDELIGSVTERLKEEGFGVLTRIDLDTKISEKLGKKLPRTVILGACNPQLAYEAVMKSPEVTGLLPCNVVLRDAGSGMTSIEIAKPSAMMASIGDSELTQLAGDADKRLQRVLSKLSEQHMTEAPAGV